MKFAWKKSKKLGMYKGSEPIRNVLWMVRNPKYVFPKFPMKFELFLYIASIWSVFLKKKNLEILGKFFFLDE